MRTLFGTDGIRGDAQTHLSSDLVREVGRAVARWSRPGARRSEAGARIVLGRDTRLSGPALEHAFIEGACAAGADVLTAGVLPTPGVAYLMNLLSCDVGIVISASHNPPADNGIKVFGPGGWKLSNSDEAAIEALVGTPGTTGGAGAASELPEAVEAYITHLDSVAVHDLRGLSVVADCGNGAASPVAPEALKRIGVDVTAINASLDGSLINDGCGALYPEVVAVAAKHQGAIGLTFDGDADRVLLADEEGCLVDGDAILAVLAQALREQGLLRNDAIVATVMANQALRRWCEAEGVKLIETAVGDRHVLVAMREHDLILGGEQSGHIIRLDRATTGDGILAAIGVLDAVAASGKRLAELVPFRPFPQVLVNVKTTQHDQIERNAMVRSAIAKAEKCLGTDGRVLVRASGTEPLVRVMVEASEKSLAVEIADQVADIVCSALDGAR